MSRTYTGRFGRDVPYMIFVPHSFTGMTAVPVIFFLHGAAESGTDGMRQITVGLGPHIARQEVGFPFLALFPQSRRGGWRAGSADAERAVEMIDQVRAEYNIDADRIHLTGISMGGYGVWSLAVAYPERWASIVPVCGGGDPGEAARIKDIPCWCFHGEADDVVPVERSREMVEALRAAGGTPRYTEFSGVGHNSWDPAYSTPELYDWWAEQHR